MNGSDAALKVIDRHLRGKTNETLAYGDLRSYCDEFKIAVELYDAKLIDKSLCYFQLAYGSVKRSDIYHNKYASYYGAVRALDGDRGGLVLCREVARTEKNDADVFLNLARAERHFLYRKKSIMALIKGIKIDSGHLGILKMREELGVRRRVAFSKFDRNHMINSYIGKRLRKKID